MSGYVNHMTIRLGTRFTVLGRYYNLAIDYCELHIADILFLQGC